MVWPLEDRWFDVGNGSTNGATCAPLPQSGCSVHHARLAGDPCYDSGHPDAGRRCHQDGRATAYWAEAPSSPPNFIFPFMAPGYFTTANVQQFQQLMYRPLYWMGKGSTPDLNPTLSLAKPPVYGSGNTVVITLKPYKWSDGESLDARNVMFWMNMLHAEKVNWAAYTPGAFPDNVVNVVADSSTQLTFTLNKSYNPDWFTDNELSQITPMPLSWDITTKGAAPGSGRCSAAAYGRLDLACDAVYNFLSDQAGSNPADPPRDQPRRDHLRLEPPLAGGGRTLAAEVAQLGRHRDHDPQSDVLRPAFGHLLDLRGASLRLRRRRTERRHRGPPRCGLPASVRCLEAHVGPRAAGQRDGPPGRDDHRPRSTPGPSTTSPTTSTRRATPRSPGRSSPSSTSGRPSSYWSTSRPRSRRL